MLTVVSYLTSVLLWSIILICIFSIASSLDKSYKLRSTSHIDHALGVFNFLIVFIVMKLTLDLFIFVIKLIIKALT